jgi:adenylyl- and sulfurtransferase ThiI
MVEEKFHVELSRIQLQIEDLQEQLRHAEEEHQSVVIRRYMYRLAKEVRDISCARLYSMELYQK